MNKIQEKREHRNYVQARLVIRLGKNYTVESEISKKVQKALWKLSADEIDALYAMVLTSVK
jgi:hypothetical protein